MVIINFNLNKNYFFISLWCTMRGYYTNFFVYWFQYLMEKNLEWIIRIFVNFFFCWRIVQSHLQIGHLCTHSHSKITGGMSWGKTNIFTISIWLPLDFTLKVKVIVDWNFFGIINYDWGVSFVDTFRLFRVSKKFWWEITGPEHWECNRARWNQFRW